MRTNFLCQKKKMYLLYFQSYDAKSFDFWTLKKSILNTLLQAVKAIKGGVIAIKGKLIQGGGNLISAKGRLISKKGEAITNLGKHIIHTAMLTPAAPSYMLHPDEIGHSGELQIKSNSVELV